MSVYKLRGRLYGYRAVLVALTLLAANSALAVPLGLVQNYPDVFSNFIAINYDSGTDAFTAVGTSWQLSTLPGPTVTNIIGGFNQYLLNATIDSSGVASAGTLTIGGSIPSMSASSPLITGTLLTPDGFGFVDPPGGGSFEFLFDITGGSLASLFAPNNRIAVIMTLNSGTAFNGTFTSNFSDTFAVADNFLVGVPEPVSAMGTMCALAGLGWFLTGRKRSA